MASQDNSQNDIQHTHIWRGHANGSGKESCAVCRQSKPDSQNDTELREQIADVIDEAIDMHSDSALCGERSDYAGNKPYDQTDKLLALIADREREARIDEWERMNAQYPTAPYIPDFIWRERLKALQATKPEKGIS